MRTTTTRVYCIGGGIYLLGLTAAAIIAGTATPVLATIYAVSGIAGIIVGIKAH